MALKIFLFATWSFLHLVLIFFLSLFFHAVRRAGGTDDFCVGGERDSFKSFFKANRNRDLRAFVRCSSEKKIKMLHENFEGIATCALFKRQYGSAAICQSACIGLGDCARICPSNAISIRNRTAVVQENCTGCGLCVNSCPNGLLHLASASLPVEIPCASSSEETCSVSCSKCGNCVELVPALISMDERAAKLIDSKQIDGFKIDGALVEKMIASCPKSLVRKTCFRHGRRYSILNCASTLTLKWSALWMRE